MGAAARVADGGLPWTGTASRKSEAQTAPPHLPGGRLYSTRIQQRHWLGLVPPGGSRLLTCPNDSYRPTWDLFASRRSLDLRPVGTLSVDAHKLISDRR